MSRIWRESVIANLILWHSKGWILSSQRFLTTPKKSKKLKVKRFYKQKYHNNKQHERYYTSSKVLQQGHASARQPDNRNTHTTSAF
jgi:hypothetical protein